MEGEISLYNESDIINYKEIPTYEIRDNLDNTLSDDDEYYRVKGGDTLRSIANLLYQDARLYKIIGEFNKIIDPWQELKAGITLRYPTLKRIFEEIL